MHTDRDVANGFDREVGTFGSLNVFRVEKQREARHPRLYTSIDSPLESGDEL